MTFTSWQVICGADPVIFNRRVLNINCNTFNHLGCLPVSQNFWLEFTETFPVSIGKTAISLVNQKMNVMAQEDNKMEMLISGPPWICHWRRAAGRGGGEGGANRQYRHQTFSFFSAWQTQNNQHTIRILFFEHDKHSFFLGGGGGGGYFPLFWWLLLYNGTFYTHTWLVYFDSCGVQVRMVMMTTGMSESCGQQKQPPIRR